MFSLNGAVKYKYIPNYQDMRGGYDKLCGVVRSLGEDPDDGTAYVFTSKNQKIVKIIRKYSFTFAPGITKVKVG